MYENIVKNIIKLISDRIRQARDKKHLRRREILKYDEIQVSNIVHNRPTRSYPYLLGAGIISDLVKNSKLPFKNQSELLWGVNSHHEMDWRDILSQVIFDYCTNIKDLARIPVLVNKVLLNDVDYAKFKAIFDQKDFLFNSPIHASYVLDDIVKESVPDNLEYLVQDLSEEIQIATINEFDIPDKLKYPDITYSHVKLLSVSMFKKLFILRFKDNPLNHFQTHFTEFANNYMKELLKECCTALNDSPMSFGLQTYNCISTFINFQKEALNDGDGSLLDEDIKNNADDGYNYNIATGAQTAEEMQSPMKDLWKYTLSHVKKLATFQDEFNDKDIRNHLFD